MAEGLGVVSSIITIWDQVSRAKEYHGKLKAAPATWTRYCNGLESLACVQSVLADMIESEPRLSSLMIEIEDSKSQSLVEFVNGRLEIVRKEAADILDRHEKLQKKPSKQSSKSKRVRAWELAEWFQRNKAAYKFVLDEQDIRDHMRRQAEALERLEADKKLSQRALEVQAVPPPPDRQCPRSSTGGISSFSRKLESVRSSKAFSKRQRSRPKLPSPSRTLPALPVKWSGTGPGETREDPHGSGELETQADIYDAEDENVDDETDDEPVDDGDASSSESSEITTPGESQEREYVLIRCDGKILSVATDSEAYQSAVSGNQVDIDGTETARLDDIVAAMTDEEWAKYAESGPEELWGFITSAPCSTYCSDAEFTNETPTIRIDLQRPICAFIGQTVDLKGCISETMTSLSFCVRHICVTETCQTLTIQEPCQGSCQHVTLEMMDTFSVAKTVPYTIAFQSMSCDALATRTDETDSDTRFILDTFERCQGRKRCAHTVVEHTSLLQPGCVLSVKLQAWLGDNGWESETPTEKPASDTEDDTSRPEGMQDYNEGAFALLQTIRRSSCPNGADIPTRVQFDDLIGFLKLTERLSLGDPYLSQGKRWAEALLPSIPKSLNRDAVAWLWILWKFQMRPEFKKLSGIIQRQAKHRIDQEANEYDVRIPEQIIDSIEQRRVLALSQVRDCVNSLISSTREKFTDTFAEAQPLWVHHLRVMSSALTAGYLILESGRCFPDDQQPGKVDFSGLSFVHVSNWVRSMIDLGDWMVRTVPPASRMPSLLAGLTSFVPVLGVGLHQAGISTCLSSAVNEKLRDLITRLEGEDWGVDLI